MYCKGTKQRVYLEHLREISLHFYNAWYQIIQEGEPFILDMGAQEKQILTEIINQITKYKDTAEKASHDRNNQQITQQLYQ